MKLPIVLVFSVGLCLALFEIASGTIGFKVAGRLFSICFPHIGKAGVSDGWTGGTVYMMTEERRAIVRIDMPPDDDGAGGKDPSSSSSSSFTPTELTLTRYKPHQERVAINRNDTPTASGTIQNAILIEASAAIRVTVSRISGDNRYWDTYNLIPHESCFNRYYVSTGKGFPFFAVMAFVVRVRVKVTFPKTDQSFDFPCQADKPCKDDSKVIVTLRCKTAWYVKLGEDYHFRNTLLEADSPVFVIAGNEVWIDQNAEKDLLVTSIRAMDSWGKEYITPLFIRPNANTERIILQFNVEKLPFHFRTFDGTTERDETVDRLGYPLEYDAMAGPYVISADVPFGLYQIFAASRSPSESCDAGLATLVPVEQWSNGGFITYRHPGRVTYVLLTTAATNGVVVSGKGNGVAWQLPVQGKRRTYNYGRMTIRAYPITFFTKDPTARVVVYQFKQTHKLSACSVWAMDFYASKIYDIDCKRTTAITNDGIDNDCDGHVDEEVENGTDDDGDGKVDEDTIEANADGQWTPWTDACESQCAEAITTFKVRSCRKTRFGEDCRGPDNVCQPGPACPRTCHGKPVSPTCKCQRGCRACQNHTSTCSACHAGYYDDEYCLRRCPHGWTDLGCSVGPGTFEFLTEDEGETFESTLINVVVCLTIAVVVLMVIGVCCYMRKVKQREAQKKKHIKKKKKKKTKITTVKKMNYFRRPKPPPPPPPPPKEPSSSEESDEEPPPPPPPPPPKPFQETRISTKFY